MAKKHGNIPTSRSKAYEALRSHGLSKEMAARIAWKGVTFSGRSSMAKKAAKTRAKGR
jgi:hypothetical protein